MLAATNPVAITLIDAKALISDPERWCQFGFAVDKNGNYCKANDDGATRWCAIGAVDRTWVTVDSRERAMRLLGTAALELNELPGFVSSNAAGDPDLVTCVWPSAINDRLGHQAVMEMYQIAINKALTETEPREHESKARMDTEGCL